MTNSRKYTKAFIYKNSTKSSKICTNHENLQIVFFKVKTKGKSLTYARSRLAKNDK